MRRQGGSLVPLQCLIFSVVCALALGRSPGRAGDLPPGRTAKPIQGEAAARSRVSHLTSKLPFAFEVNQGQTDAAVHFLSRGQGYTLFLTGEEAVLSPAAPSAPGNSKSENRKPGDADNPDVQNRKSRIPSPRIVRIRVLGYLRVRMRNSSRAEWSAIADLPVEK